jgi:starch synthase
VTLKVLAVTSEAYPIAKTGGLGDAVGGLAQALDAIGCEVTLMLPAYRGVVERVSNLRRVAQLTGMPGGDATLLVCECRDLGLPLILVQNDSLYDRDGLYQDAEGCEYPDNAIRFAALAQAAARVGAGIVGIPRPDIVHAHDWHTALVPIYLRQLKAVDVKTILTLHNIAFQGVFPMDTVPALGIQPAFATRDGGEYWGQFNFLKAGIRYADLVTVVSRNYAREILSPEFGCGLQGVLQQRGSDLISIPNGIDTSLWNPCNDSYLPGLSFDVDHLALKAVCKRKLKKCFGLDELPDAVLVAMGSRLTTQKMADVAAEAIPRVLDEYPGLQFCIMGKGEKALERALKEIERRYSGRCSVYIGFDEKRAHLLHAGADVLLHGSRFEPFGLTPLYSMRYGTIPIGSKLGGMVDTIQDPGSDKTIASMRTASGILFQGDRPSDMVAAIARVMALRKRPEIWKAMQRNAMTVDFSWTGTAPAYMSAFQGLRPDVELDRIPERQRKSGVMPRPAPAFAGIANGAAPSQGGAVALSGNGRQVRKGLRTDTLASPTGASAA